MALLLAQSGFVVDSWNNFCHVHLTALLFYQLSAHLHIRCDWQYEQSASKLYDFPAKGQPELISSIPTRTVNLDQQLEIINVRLYHLTPNAFFSLVVLLFLFSQISAAQKTRLQWLHLPAIKQEHLRWR